MLLEAFIKKKPVISRATQRDHLISFIKGISWRVIGTIDTIIISYIITGKWNFALKIGSIEVITKIILFYFHDRAWEMARRKVNTTTPTAVVLEKNKEMNAVEVVS